MARVLSEIPRRNKLIGVAVTPEEHAQIRKNANGPMATFMRNLALETPGPQYPPEPELPEPEPDPEEEPAPVPTASSPSRIYKCPVCQYQSVRPGQCPVHAKALE